MMPSMSVFVIRCTAPDLRMHVAAAETFPAAVDEAHRVMPVNDWRTVVSRLKSAYADPQIEDFSIPGLLMIKRVEVRR